LKVKAMKSSTTCRRTRQQTTSPLLANSVSLPHSVRSRVVCVERGVVIGLGATLAEAAATAIMNTGGA
jgi:hypothetical protein